MSLYLVTGQSGTGKTTLLHEFKNRDIRAYGTDEDRIARHRFIKSGKFLTKTDYKASKDTNFDWLHDINYQLDPKMIEQLKNESSTQDVFLFGGADDLSNHYGEFAKIFGLIVDEETHKHRIQNRTGNTWGKKPDELKHILHRRETAETELRNIGAVIVDASLPLSQVADFILSHTN